MKYLYTLKYTLPNYEHEFIYKSIDLNDIWLMADLVARQDGKYSLDYCKFDDFVEVD